MQSMKYCVYEILQSVWSQGIIYPVWHHKMISILVKWLCIYTSTKVSVEPYSILQETKFRNFNLSAAQNHKTQLFPGSIQVFFLKYLVYYKQGVTYRYKHRHTCHQDCTSYILHWTHPKIMKLYTIYSFHLGS